MRRWHSYLLSGNIFKIFSVPAVCCSLNLKTFLSSNPFPRKEVRICGKYRLLRWTTCLSVEDNLPSLSVFLSKTTCLSVEDDLPVIENNLLVCRIQFTFLWGIGHYPMTTCLSIEDKLPANIQVAVKSKPLVLHMWGQIKYKQLKWLYFEQILWKELYLALSLTNE